MRPAARRRPSPALIVALIALVVAATPAADAATVAVKRALFADNAGKVGGIRASKTPKAGQLLALGKNKKFPRSVLPLLVGPSGPRGLAGPQGPPGVNGTNATINGATAGGALTGTYPSPSLAAGAVVASSFGTLPAARVTGIADPSIDEDVVTEVHFTTEEFDTQGLWTPAASQCLTAPVAGLYSVTASVRWDEDLASESFFVAIATPSGRKASEWVKANEIGATDQAVSTLVRLDAGHCVRLLVMQNASDAVSITGSSVGGSGPVDSPTLTMTFVGRNA